MKSLTSLGYGVYIPPPGMPGSPWQGDSARGIEALSNDELKTFVEFGTLAALLNNILPPTVNRLMDQTQNGLLITSAARTTPGLTEQQRGEIKASAAIMAQAVENAIPQIRRNIPEAFRQLDQAADLLAKNTSYEVKFYGPIYYADQMRTSVLEAVRVPAKIKPVGIYDFTGLKNNSPKENAKRMLDLYPRMIPILETVDPSLKGKLKDFPPESLAEVQVALSGTPSLGIAPLLVLLGEFLAVIAAHINLTVVASIAVTAVIIGVVAFAAVAVLVILVAKLIGAALPVLDTAVKAIAPPLLSGVQWIMIFVGLGLGIGLIFAGPTLINRLESMFTGAVREAGTGRRIGREVPPPSGAPAKEATGF